MSNSPNPLFSKVLELNKTGGFVFDRRMFFAELLDLVLAAELADLQAVEPMLGNLCNPSGHRAVPLPECDLAIYLVHNQVEKRIAKLEPQAEHELPELNERRLLILQFMEPRPWLSEREIANTLGMLHSVVRLDLQAMQRAGFVVVSDAPDAPDRWNITSLGRLLALGRA